MSGVHSFPITATGRFSTLQALRISLALVITLGLFVAAYSARRAIVEAQYREWGRILPFTLESALYYRRVKIVYDTGRLPRHDPMVQYPEGINTHHTYTTGSEYVYAFLARFFPRRISFPDRLRHIEAGWYSLAIPLLAWGVYRRTRSVTAGLWSGLFFALGLSSVIRSTGLELSHENFAMPFMALHAALTLAAPSFGGARSRKAAQIVAAAGLGLSLCGWDLAQYYAGLVLIVRAWREIRGKAEDLSTAWLEYAALCAVGLLHPYYAAKSFLTSSLMGLAHGLALWRLLESRRLFAVRKLVYRAAAVVLVLLSTVALIRLLHTSIAPDDAYGHFARLVWAKLRFLNRKPADPSLLTFEQRIMWVPALNSTDWSFAAMMFPALWLLTFPAIVIILRRCKSIGAGAAEVIFYLIVSALAFWLFARFHIYVSLFACLALGIAWAEVHRAGALRRAIAVLLYAAVLLAEAAHTLRRPERWGRVNVYYEELQDLTNWLERRVAPEPVLANFGVSGAIAAYGKCAILLHPKFESAAIRRRVREYGEALFHRTEKEFRDWADRLGARYYVHAFGEFASQQVDLQMRYIVNALNPRADAAARGFEFDPENRTWFILLHRNVKYAVFKMVTGEDERLADEAAARAERCFQQGQLDETRSACLDALRYFPRHPRALELLGHAASLEAKGFRGVRPD